MRKLKSKESALERVKRMRAALLEDEPFYGFLALRLKLVEDPECETMWTDGCALGYNPAFALGVAEVELKGTICHEVLPVVGKHPWRQEFREHGRWNEACDYAINPLVRQSGYVLPYGVLFDVKYIGWSAEAIYRDLGGNTPPQPKPKPQPGKGGSDEDGQGQGAGKDEDEDEGEEGSDKSAGSEIKRADSNDPSSGAQQPGKPAQGKTGKSKAAGEVRMAPPEAQESSSDYSEQGWDMAIQSAINAHGGIPVGLDRYVAAAQKHKVNWAEVLREFFERSSNSPDYVWRTPAMRYVPLGLYMPRLEGQQLPPFVFAIDSSGSIPPADLAQAQAEMQALLDELKPEVLYVLYCDAKVVAAQAFYPGDIIDLTPKGGGGTDFRPVFDWVAENAPDAAGIVYVTDLLGTFPKEEDVDVPTLWVATSTTPDYLATAKPPFGGLVQLPVE